MNKLYASNLFIFIKKKQDENEKFTKYSTNVRNELPELINRPSWMRKNKNREILPTCTIKSSSSIVYVISLLVSNVRKWGGIDGR